MLIRLHNQTVTASQRHKEDGASVPVMSNFQLPDSFRVIPNVLRGGKQFRDHFFRSIDIYDQMSRMWIQTVLKKCMNARVIGPV